MEDQCNLKWKALLKIFHGIKMDASDAKKKYEQLKELAAADGTMTPRQKEGIMARCDNAINGSYGKSKRPEHYSQQHNFSSNGQEK